MVINSSNARLNLTGKSNRHQNWFIDEQMIDKIKYLNDKNVRKTIKNNIKNSIVKGRNPKRCKLTGFFKFNF